MSYLKVTTSFEHWILFCETNCPLSNALQLRTLLTGLTFTAAPEKLRLTDLSMLEACATAEQKIRSQL